MKPYVNKNGKVIFDKNKPPTKQEWKDIMIRVYISDEIKLYSCIVSIFGASGDEYGDTLIYATNRLKELARARVDLLQNQPPDDVARSINVHYSEILHSYI